MKIAFRRSAGTVAALFAGVGILLAVGCASPISDPSRLMQRTTMPPNLASTGKSLVCIHRPRNMQGYKLYANIWDGKRFIADLGNGNSIAYACEPGKHTFVCRSVEVVSVIDADLADGKTYDLWVDISGTWIASFKMKPIKAGDKRHKEIANWSKDNLWVTVGSDPSDYEQKWSKELDLIIHDFTVGEKRERLQHLTADDCR